MIRVPFEVKEASGRRPPLSVTIRGHTWRTCAGSTAAAGHIGVNRWVTVERVLTRQPQR
jgi:hypothetical protein